MDTSSLRGVKPLGFWLPALVLVLLLSLAGTLWYLSETLGGPLSAADGRASTDGYDHVRSVYGNGSDRLNRPIEVATDSNGQVYVTDSFKHRVVVFDSQGAFVRTLGGPANVEGALNYPSSVRVDELGRVYVTSSEPGRIVVFGPGGDVVNQFEIPEPLTLALTSDRVYVATAAGILIGDLEGNQVGQLSSRGKTAGSIDRPTGLAVGDNGTVYVADSLNYRFQALSADGESLWIAGDGPDPETAVTDRTRSYGLPASIALGSDGLLYGVDAMNGQIVVLDPEDGSQIASFGEWGRQDGAFYYPTGIAQLAPELFVVADTFNDRIQFVGVPTPRPDALTFGKRSLPWFAPVILALALVPLLRRKPAVVVDVRGLRHADSMVLLAELLDHSRTLYCPPGTLAEVADLVDDEPRLTAALVEVEYDETGEFDSPALDIALQLRGRFGLRRVALAFPDDQLAEVAARHGVGVLGEDGPPMEDVQLA